jgi:hypothetical protein
MDTVRNVDIKVVNALVINQYVDVSDVFHIFHYKESTVKDVFNYQSFKIETGKNTVQVTQWTPLTQMQLMYCQNDWIS